MRITRSQLRRIIKEELGRTLNERKRGKKGASTNPNVGYSEDDGFHKFGVEIDKDMFAADAEAAKTMAIDDALEALQAMGIDVSKGHRVLKTGHSDGVLVVGVAKVLRKK